MKYGVVVMRAQPFHKGHEYIVQQIIEDGLQPIIILGSANESGTEKNPFTTLQRAEMIRLVYPDIWMTAVNDFECYGTWLDSIINHIEFITHEDLKHSTIYLHEKAEDRHDFTFKGVDYKNESYCKMYEIEGLQTKALILSDIHVRAKDIRDDLEGNKHFLHEEVYNYIKDLL